MQLEIKKFVLSSSILVSEILDIDLCKILRLEWLVSARDIARTTGVVFKQSCEPR